MLPTPRRRYHRWGSGLTVDEFWSLASPCPNTGCWIWTGPTGSDGYAMANVDGERDFVHRLAVRLSTGMPLRRGCRFHVRHLCNNKWCFNPAHVVAGTASENMADANRHRRAALHNQHLAQPPE